MNEERSSVKNRLIRYREINHFTIQPVEVFKIYSFMQLNTTDHLVKKNRKIDLTTRGHTKFKSLV